MHKMHKTAVFIASVLATGGLAAAPMDDYKTAHRKAMAALDIAASVNSEWRDSRKMLKKSKKLADSGKYKKAIALATVVKLQGELGYNQGIEQKNAGHPAYLKVVEVIISIGDIY